MFLNWVNYEKSFIERSFARWFCARDVRRWWILYKSAKNAGFKKKEFAV